MMTVGMDRALWAAVYLSLLEYGCYLKNSGAPTKHLRMVLDVLMPSIAAAAGNPELLAELEAELRAASGVN